MALTDTALRALKAKTTKQKISDAEGLQIWVLPRAEPDLNESGGIPKSGGK